MEGQAHGLKILPQYYEVVANLQKRFEVRKNDRDFKDGDILMLREWQDGKYTGRQIQAEIGYVLHGFEGLADGYVTFSIHVVKIIKEEY